MADPGDDRVAETGKAKKPWRHEWKITQWGEKIIIVMIGLEIIIGSVTIWLTIHEAQLQDRLQERVLSAQATLDSDLTSRLKDLDTGIGNTVDKLAQLNVEITESAQTLNKQLAVQEEEQEKQNQQPKLRVSTIVGQDGTAGPLAILSPGDEPVGTGFTLSGMPDHRVKYFFVRNIGNSPARKLRITGYVAVPAKLECVASQRIPSHNPLDLCELANINPPDLASDPDVSLSRKKSDLEIAVVFTIPAYSQSANIYLTLSGENVRTETYAVRADIP